MSPYQILADAIKSGCEKDFVQAWNDFACWELSRGYADDPNATAKEAVQWVLLMNDLATRLDDYQGSAKEECRNALEAAAAAFGRIDHEAQLCEAVRRWRDYRRAEEKAKGDTMEVAEWLPDRGPFRSAQ